MDNTKDNHTYLQTIINDIEFIINTWKTWNKTNLKNNEILQDSMMFRMIQIAENSKKISDEYKNSHQNIPWNSLKGIRNIIVHDYGNVDYHIVYKTLKQDIPSLKRLLVNEEEKG